MNRSPEDKAPTAVTAEAESAFLARDFDQAFAEKHRLEDQVWDVCKFGFTTHSALLALAIGAYQYSLERQLDLMPAVRLVLALDFLVGLFLVFLMARIRVYFVRVSRYINAQRGFFLRGDASGFGNPTGFYVDTNKPLYFSWASSHTVATMLIGFLNAVVAATLAFVVSLGQGRVTRGGLTALALLGFFAVQIVVVRGYLVRHEEPRSKS